jgi:hypothetical protein
MVLHTSKEVLFILLHVSLFDFAHGDGWLICIMNILTDVNSLLLNMGCMIISIIEDQVPIDHIL